MPNYKFSVTLGVTQPRSARERACGRLQGLPSGRDHARGSTSLEQTRPQAGEPRSPPHFPPIHTLDSWIHQAPVPSARAPTRFDDPTGAHGYDGHTMSLRDYDRRVATAMTIRSAPPHCDPLRAPLSLLTPVPRACTAGPCRVLGPSQRILNARRVDGSERSRELQLQRTCLLPPLPRRELPAIARLSDGSARAAQLPANLSRHFKPPLPYPFERRPSRLPR